MSKTYCNLPTGYAMTIVSDEVSAGLYVQTKPGSLYTPGSFAADSTTVVGPFNDARDYEISYDGNLPTITTEASGVFTSDDESTLTGKAPTAVTSNIGEAATGTTAIERGDGYQHTTILTVNTVLPAIAGGADLAVGKLVYTLPAGAVIVKNAYMSMAITQTEIHITADTPDGGLGTTIASGAVSVLGGTAGFENILTGQTFNDCDGTAEVKTVSQEVVIEAAGDHTIYFNVADGWAENGDVGALLTGTIVLHWQFLA